MFDTLALAEGEELGSNILHLERHDSRNLGLKFEQASLQCVRATRVPVERGKRFASLAVTGANLR